jgi:hypothetical protein
MAAVLPSFISHYTVRLPGSLVYVGACNSTTNPSLTATLLGLGASTVLGFDGYVDSDFARDVSVDLFTQLVAGQQWPGFTLVRPTGAPPATFAWWAASGTRRLRDREPGFEYSSGSSPASPASRCG